MLIHDDDPVIAGLMQCFMHDDLGYFDDETCRLEPIENPFGPKVLPLRSEWTRPARSGSPHWTIPQLSDPGGRVNGLSLTRSARFREVSLGERRSCLAAGAGSNRGLATI